MKEALILSLTAVSVVFTCLFILFGVYSLSGAIFSGKFRRSSKPEAPAGETPAAQGADDELVAAAIAAALEAETGSLLHDKESGLITITHAGGAWNNRARAMRQAPRRN